MERITEAELMDNTEQAAAYAAADFSAAHDLFVQQFQQVFADIPDYYNDVMLDLGCGNCDVTRRMARAYADAGFHALDGAAAMLQQAEQQNRDAGLQTRIKLIESRLPQPALPQSQYHVIFSNSLLHHLHDPQVLWQTIHQHAKPYAHVFVMDLLRPKDEATVKFLVSEYASNEPEILQTDFAHSLRAAFTEQEVQQQLEQVGLALKVATISDRHMIIYGVL